MTRALTLSLILLASIASVPWTAGEAHAQEDVCEAVLHDTLGMMMPCTDGPPSAHDACEDILHDGVGLMIPCPP